MFTATLMKKLTLAATGATVIALGATTKVEAGQIVTPVSISTSMGNSGQPIENLINQSGLSVGYTSGVTDFDDYLSGDPTHSGGYSEAYWASSFGIRTGGITFDFGEVIELEGMVLWNGVPLSFVAGVSFFDLIASSSLGGEPVTLLGPFFAHLTFPFVQPSPAQVFDFNTTARFIQMIIRGNHGNPNFTGFGEVAFHASSTSTAEFPEPTGILGLVAALSLGAASTLKRQRKAS